MQNKNGLSEMIFPAFIPLHWTWHGMARHGTPRQHLVAETSVVEPVQASGVGTKKMGFTKPPLYEV
jgi:hypothetical protein